MFLGFLLPVCLGFLIFDLLRRSSPSIDLREVILIEAIMLGVAVVLSTEILNTFHALTTGGVICWWSLECLAVNYYRVRLPRAEPLKIVSRGLYFFRDTRLDELGMLLVIAIFAIVMLLVGLFATPNNWDSMTYHLARVAHWRQDQSISFYGTNIIRQNFMPPWAEWSMLQLTLLQGDDRLVNLVQWMSYIGCLIGVCLITELLGGGRREGIFAAFFMATLSGAIFEATSTQNDLVMSFWLVCAVYGCVKLSLQPGRLGIMILGAGLGLAMLTKTVTLIFAMPLCLWAVWALGRHGLKTALPQLMVIALIAVALNTGHCARNLVTSGYLFGPDQRDKNGSLYANDSHTFGAIFSNMLRNASLHASVFNREALAERVVIKIHRMLGLDPQDPRTTFLGSAYRIRNFGEDGAPMPFHLATIILSFIALLWNYRRLNCLPLALAASVLVGALLFCIILKWQPWHARLHLALFIMSAPFVALALGGVFWRGGSWLLMALFLMVSVPNVFCYPPREALGADSVFVTPGIWHEYAQAPQLARPYEDAIQILDHYKAKEVGLICWEDSWEYPLLTSQRHAVPWRVEHVLIENAYTPLETPQAPDILLCTRSGLSDVLTIHGHPYHLVRRYVQGQARDLILSIYFSENTNFNGPLEIDSPGT